MTTTGAITAHIDVAQIVLYLFWGFFAGLIIYLHRENKREGYPLDSDRTERAPRVAVQGFPAVPEPKTFRLPHGEADVSLPDRRADTRPIKGRFVAGHPGAAIEPTGNPMLDAIGPGSYAERADVTDKALDGANRIVPLRVATDHWLAKEDKDPIGFKVVGDDGVVAGLVSDVWVDRSECVARYFEVTLAGGRNVLLPMNFSRVNDARAEVHVKSILGAHFADVPALRNPDQITRLEEDKVCAYYGGGTLYATPQRQEPLL
jgi:photosynthetic reaction center H subunit